METKNQKIEHKKTETDKTAQQKKTSKITLLIFLCIILAVIAISLVQKSFVPKKSLMPTPTPLPAYVQTRLTLEALSPAPGKPISDITINLDSGNNQVTAVQFEIRFNPKLIQKVNLTPGTFLQKPVQLINTVDNKTGLAEYALGIAPYSPTAHGKGVAAIIHFTPQAGAKGFTTIEILPSSLVTSKGIAQSVLRNSYYLTFSLAPTDTVSGH